MTNTTTTKGAAKFAAQNRIERRLARFARVLRMTDRILDPKVGDVRTDETGPAPAWSDGKNIWLNRNQLPGIDTPEGMATWLGANFHELGHVMYTPRRHSPLVARITKAQGTYLPGLFGSYNMLEDMRQERLLIAQFSPLRVYLSTVVRKVVVNYQRVGQAWPLLAGRTWLPESLRKASYQAFAADNGTAKAQELTTIVADYQLLGDPGFAQASEAFDLVERFHKLLNDTGIAPPRGGCGAQPSEGDDEPAETDDVPEAGCPWPLDSDDTGDDDGDDDGDDSEGDEDAPGSDDEGESGTGDGEGEGDGEGDADDDEGGSGGSGDGESDTEGDDESGSDDGGSGGTSDEGDTEAQGGGAGSGDESDDQGTDDEVPEDVPTTGRDVADAIGEAIREAIRDEADVAEDLENISDALDDSDAEDLFDGERAVVKAKVDPTEAADLSRERISDVLRGIVADVMPRTERRVTSGRFNARRFVMADMGGRFDPAVFDRKDPGALSATDMEVVILLDRSGSMGGYVTEGSRIHAASEATWAIRHAVSDVDGRCTVIAYDHEAELASTPEDDPTGAVEVIRTQGGTDPTKAMGLAYGILAESESPNKILVAVSDGDWYSGQERMEAIRAEGVHTAMVLIIDRDQRDYYDNNPKVVESFRNGAEHLVVTTDGHQIAPVFEAIAEASMRASVGGR